jgi:hypothetical protein
LIVEPDDDAHLPSVPPRQETTGVLSQSLLNSVRKSYRALAFDPLTTLQGDFSFNEGLWCKKHHDIQPDVVIKDDAKLQKSIVHELHDSRVTTHMGKKQTTEQVSHYFWWPGDLIHRDLYQALSSHESRAKKIHGAPTPVADPLKALVVNLDGSDHRSAAL